MKKTIGRVLGTCLLAVMLLTTLMSCAGTSEIPEGYQYATCNGEFFRLFVPTQWTVNTESGVSSAFYSHTDEVSVTMAEVAFDPAEDTPQGGELKAFYERHLAQASQMKGYELKKSAAPDAEYGYLLAGRAAGMLEYAVKNGDKTYMVHERMTTEAGRYYLFTYSAVADTEAEDPWANFERWKTEVEGIMEELVFESFPYTDGDHERKIPEVDAPEDMQLVSDNEVAYRFFVPDTWIRDVNVGQNLVYASESDRSNVSVISYAPKDDQMTIEAYWEMCQKQYDDNLENFEMVGEPVATTMGEKPALVMEYTYTLGGVNYHVRQVVAKYSAMMYTMTYTALEENYETHVEEAIKMQEALTFRKWYE